MLLIDKLASSEQFKRISDAMGEGKPPVAIFGVFGISVSIIAGCLANERRVLLVTETDAQAVTAAADLATLGIPSVSFCSRDFVFWEVASVSHDAEQSRLFALGSIIKNKAKVVCASIEAVCQPTVPPDMLESASVSLKKGRDYDTEKLVSSLVRAGYSRTDTVDGRGLFSVRGGIIDVFPAASSNPVRLDFFGDALDAISEFDPLTQRSIKKRDAIFITPAREVVLSDASDGIDRLLSKKLPEKLRDIAERESEMLKSGIQPPSADRYMPIYYPRKATLLDYMDGSCVVVSDNAAVREREKNLFARMSDDLAALKDEGLLSAELCRYFSPEEPPLSSRPLAVTESFARDVGFSSLSQTVTFAASALPRWNGELKSLTDDLRQYLAEGKQVAVLAGTPRAADAVCRDLCDAGIAASLEKELSLSAAVSVCPFSLSSGFSFEREKICVVAARREAQQQKRAKPKFDSGARGIGSLEDLSVGDYVVHINNGIGIFDGVHTINYHGTVRDYIKIKYRGSDELFVPVTQLDMVALYSAPSDREPPQLAKLNSGEWAKTKQSVYREARDMAKELIELYSKRSRERGVAFSQDTEWQRDFEARFEYDETDDQLKSISEIKKDMQSEVPMDRLLCGDVGVGKTEVALRAAFKCVNDGYQCAVLVPTTILAWQHYHSFLARLESYPITVVMLSRFSTPKEIKAAVKGIADGTVDIAIGTHRLLQSDVNFRRLGLVVIDEEQRFGVGHKEKLKQAFVGVDVLTLSATPIPRTLNMAMSGIRDMSVIDEPPHGRQPVLTYVMEYDKARVADAIRQELSRGGQVYYLHNRIDTISSCAAKLAELVPEARIEVAHGRMSEAELSQVWQRLIDGECDVLVCTTIIETGVDVPNVNTLIVENADNMGLAQLYQLRGRVGRSSRRAYAYFTFKAQGVLTDVAAKRLSAIRDFTGFGSGMKIAMRDLQIRGAGSVLNARQSGHMHAVGYDMYLKILAEAIDDEKGAARPAVADCVVDLAIDAHIPASYIRSEKNRIEIYKRIAAVTSEESAADVIDEMTDRFGKVPASVNDLIRVARLRTIASSLGFYEIRGADDTIFMYSDAIDLPSLQSAARKKTREVGACTKGKSYISIKPNRGESLTAAIVDFLELLKAEGFGGTK